uniref:Ion channel protein n=1 Tax=Toxoplasma gondii COUG TaxID=1074873 RepID=A0A2G8XN95_TOXGO|nr:ion channel protein [Toxoplasma gondii COUG]
MGLQVETQSFLLRQIFRLVLDCLVVGVFLGCMAYIATVENTWTTVSARFVPSLLGWATFLSSIFIFEPLYQLYDGITTGQWPSWISRPGAEAHMHGQFSLEKRSGMKAREENLVEPDSQKALFRTKHKALRFNRLVTDFKMRRKLKFRQGFVKASVVRVLYWHHLIRHRIHRVSSRPSFALATVVWNFAWSVSWCLTLQRWRRDSYDDQWDFSMLHGSDYATQEFFLSAATLEFLMIFLQQTEILQMLLWPSFWIEMFTLPPLTVLVYFTFTSVFLNHFIAAEILLLTGWLRWIKTFFMTRFISASVVWGNATKGHVVQLVLGIIFLLTAFAAAMFTSDGVNPESIGDLDRNVYTLKEMFNFWYFGVVTMSTVGYGDISPRTMTGQCFCIAFIVTALIWLPSEFGRLIESLTSRRKVWGRLPLRIDHTAFVLLLGDVEPAQLSTFLQEVRLRRAVPPKIVVLSNHQFEDYRNQMEEAQSGQIRLCLVTGEAGIGGDPSDLLMVQPNHSQGVFVLSSPSALTAYYDRQTLTRLLSLMRLRIDPSHVAVQLCTNVCANIIASMGCLNYSILSDLKMGLIAKALCGHSGIIPLICNLSGSTYPDVPLGKLTKQFPPETLPGLCEYVKGALHSLYAFRVPPCMFGVPFEEICLGLYYCANIICVGIERDPEPRRVDDETAFGCGIGCANVGTLCKRMLERKPQKKSNRRRASASSVSPANSSMPLCLASQSSSDFQTLTPRSRDGSPGVRGEGALPRQGLQADGAHDSDGSRHVSFLPSGNAVNARTRARASPTLRARKRAGGSGSDSGSHGEQREDQRSHPDGLSPERRHTSVSGLKQPKAAPHFCPSLSCCSSVLTPEEANSDSHKTQSRPRDPGLPFYGPSAAQKISFWVNPAGAHYCLSEGDKCVIIAPSVGAAEFLESATVVPWSHVFSSPLGRFVDLLATQPARAAAQAAGQAVALAVDAKEAMQVAITATKDAVGNVARTGSDDEGSAVLSARDDDMVSKKAGGTGTQVTQTLSPKKHRERPNPPGGVAGGARGLTGVGGDPATPQEGKRDKSFLDKPTQAKTVKGPPDSQGQGDSAGNVQKEGSQEGNKLRNGEETAPGADGQHEGSRHVSGSTHEKCEVEESQVRGRSQPREETPALGMDAGSLVATVDGLQRLRGPDERKQSRLSEGSLQWSRTAEREKTKTAGEEKLEPRGQAKQFSPAAQPSMAFPHSSSTEWGDGLTLENGAPGAPVSDSRLSLRPGNSRAVCSASVRESRDARPEAQQRFFSNPEDKAFSTDRSASFTSSPGRKRQRGESNNVEVSYSFPSPSSRKSSWEAEPHSPSSCYRPAYSVHPQAPSDSPAVSSAGSPSNCPKQSIPSLHCLTPPPSGLTALAADGRAASEVSASSIGALAPRLLPLHFAQPAFPLDGDREPANVENVASSLNTERPSEASSWTLDEGGGYVSSRELNRGRRSHDHLLRGERDRDEPGLKTGKSWAKMPAAIPSPLQLREGRTTEISPSAAAGASTVIKRLFSAAAGPGVSDRHPIQAWDDGGDEEATVPVVHVGDQEDDDRDLDPLSVGCAEGGHASTKVVSSFPEAEDDPGEAERSIDAFKKHGSRHSGRDVPERGISRDAAARDEGGVTADPRRSAAVAGNGDSDASEDSSTDESDIFAEPNKSYSDQIFASSYQEARRLIFFNPDRPLILICGWPKHIGGLLMKIKAIGGWNVIVLTAEAPPPWGDLRYVLPFRRFTAIVQARPLSEINLVRAGVLDAKRFFIFPLGLDNTLTATSESIAQQDDRNVILVYLQIKNLLLQKADMLLRLRTSLPQWPGVPGWRGPPRRSGAKTGEAAEAPSRSGTRNLRRRRPQKDSPVAQTSAWPARNDGVFAHPLFQRQAVHQQSFPLLDEGRTEPRGETPEREPVCPRQTPAFGSEDSLRQQSQKRLRVLQSVHRTDYCRQDGPAKTEDRGKGRDRFFHDVSQHSACPEGRNIEGGLQLTNFFPSRRHSSLPVCMKEAKGTCDEGCEERDGQRGWESWGVPTDPESRANEQLGHGLEQCRIVSNLTSGEKGRSALGDLLASATERCREEVQSRRRPSSDLRPEEKEKVEEADTSVKRGQSDRHPHVDRVGQGSTWKETEDDRGEESKRSSTCRRRPADCGSSDFPFASVGSAEIMKIASEASLKTDSSPSCLDTELLPQDFLHGNLELGREFLSDNLASPAGYTDRERVTREGMCAAASTGALQNRESQHLSPPKRRGVSSSPASSLAVSSSCRRRITACLRLSRMANNRETGGHSAAHNRSCGETTDQQTRKEIEGRPAVAEFDNPVRSHKDNGAHASNCAENAASSGEHQGASPLSRHARRNALQNIEAKEEEALMLELHDQNNWRFVNDDEWIDRNVKDYPCYSSATYLLSPEYISGNLFADRMNFSFLTQHPAISPYSVTPQFLSELIGYAFTGNWPGIQLESIPPSSLEEGLTFGDLFRTLLLDKKKIAVGLYRCGVGSLRSYVYTCPPRHCLLESTDRVFVIPVGFPRPPLSPEKVIKRVNAYLAKTVAANSR